MKHKIAYRLTISMLVVVLVSIFAIGVVFIQLFQAYTFSNREDLMMSRAETIAKLVAGGNGATGSMHGMGGLMRYIELMSEADVWILDQDGKIVQITGRGMMSGNKMILGSSEPLPKEAENIIQTVLNGEKSVSRGFSGVYKEATLTVGAPIKSSNGSTVGVVLLHSSVKGINKTVNQALWILGAGILVALAFAFGAAWFFSKAISAPLLRMNTAARRMAEGDYEIRTEEPRMDEVGELSRSLDELAETLGKNMKELEAQEQLRRDFVANVSHEFRTPLTVIQGSLEALLDHAVEEEQEKEAFLRRMVQETKGLERLVADLLDLSKLQLGESALKKEWISLREWMDVVFQSMASIGEKKGMKLMLKATEDVLSAGILGDYDRLVQLMKIFLSNSMKYGSENSLVTVTLSKVTAEKEWVQIEIQDEGEGIAPEDMPHIWERFYRGDKSRGKTKNEKVDGNNGNSTGLGLSIAKEIVEAHEGEVEATSEKGQGTKVHIRLPMGEEKRNGKDLIEKT